MDLASFQLTFMFQAVTKHSWDLEIVQY